MVSIYIAMALRDSKILIKGSLNRIRDFIYIDDVINFWLKAINLDFVDQHNPNLGTGMPCKSFNLIKILRILL